MTRLIILILTLCYSLTAKADLPGSAFQYDRYSENGKFYFKSIPFYNYDLTNYGKTIIFDSDGDKELYTIDNYLPSEAFISNDSKSLLTTTYWMWGHSDFEDQILINIYLGGKDSIQYRIDDLVSNKTKLHHTSSHTLWYDRMFVKNDTLFVLTLEAKVVKIDMRTGILIDRQDLSECKLCSESIALIEPKTEYYRDIIYPKGYIFPDLLNGKPFRESLITDLGKAEVEDYSDCHYYIMIYGTIEKNGTCEIFMLRTSVDKEDNNEWEKQVSDWVTSQQYKTELIPKNCDRWVFQEYFYLN